MQIDLSHVMASIVGGIVSHLFYLALFQKGQLLANDKREITFDEEQGKLNKEPPAGKTTAPKGRAKKGGKK